MKHSKQLLLGAGVAATAAALALSGCSSSTPTSGDTGSGALTPVKLQLQWVEDAQFAGYYAALDQGYYEDEGLDVTIVPSGTDTVPIDELTSGNVDYAISWVPKVLGSIENGAAVTDVAQIFERSGTTQISFKDKGITDPADLAGKNVGSWGYGNEWELMAGLQDAGIDTDPASGQYNLVQQAFDMNGFLNGDIDAAQAMTYNEYAQVLESVNPATGEQYTADDLNVINWNDYGTAMLQDAIWADADRLKSDTAYQDTTEKFIKASIEGWIYARDNPQEAADIVLNGGDPSVTIGASHQLWMTNEVNKLIWPSENGIGLINEDEWQQTVDVAMNTKNPQNVDSSGKILPLITTEPPSTAYDNTYVQKALDDLKAEGVDVNGTGFTPLTVTLNEGGK